MNLSPRKLNLFLLVNLPSAFFCGVRVKSINSDECIASVKHRWINKNPFNSMYFAVQAMAAELTTGALVMLKIRNSGIPISMLVANSKSSFTKKATGRITFKCIQGATIDGAIQKTVETGEGQTIWLQSIGYNEKGEEVSVMDFEWTVKRKA